MRNRRKVAALLCVGLMLLNNITAYAELSISKRNMTILMATENCSKLAVSQVSDYVNIRKDPNTTSEIVGKIYNNCAAEIIETVNGENGKWYKIESGSVSGYIKAQYFITGNDAEKLAQEIRRRYATVDATNLRLRAEPNLNSEVLTMLSTGSKYIIEEEVGDFYKVEVDETLVGYIAKEYCNVTVEFDRAISIEEEQQLKAAEEERKANAEKAIEELRETLTERVSISVETPSEPVNTPEIGFISPNPESSTVIENQVDAPEWNVTVIDQNTKAEADTETEANTNTTLKADLDGKVYVSDTEIGPGMDMSKYKQLMFDSENNEIASATRTAVVAYAKQFLGNPYVYGGTDLVNGTDCSGFTMGIYKYFGINTGRTSRDQAANIKKISFDEIQIGDLIFYASGDYINHVAMYIGNGEIIHAAGRKTGIIISNYDYRTPYMYGTFLGQ